MTFRRKILLGRMIDAGIPCGGISSDNETIKYFSVATPEQRAQAQQILAAWVAEGGDNPLASKEDRLRDVIVRVVSSDKFIAAQALLIDELSGGPACPAPVKTFYRQEADKLRRGWA